MWVPPRFLSPIWNYCVLVRQFLDCAKANKQLKTKKDMIWLKFGLHAWKETGIVAAWYNMVVLNFSDLNLLNIDQVVYKFANKQINMWRQRYRISCRIAWIQFWKVDRLERTINACERKNDPNMIRSREISNLSLKWQMFTCYCLQITLRFTIHLESWTQLIGACLW